jgi:hypothetical protein
MMMNERLLREWIHESLKSGDVISLLNEETLQADHFPDHPDPSSNTVVQTAINDSLLDKAFKARFDDTMIYVKKPGEGDKTKWVGTKLPKGTPVTLVTTSYTDIKKPAGMGGSGKNYVEVTAAGQTGLMLVTKIDHSVTGGKESQKITSDGKIGKTAEYALAQALSGQQENHSSALERAKLMGNYDGASREDKKKFREIYSALYNAAVIAKGALETQGITLSAASVPDDPNAVVDVNASIAEKGVTREAEIHVKYNDPNRKFGLQPGLKLKDSETERQYIVKDADGTLGVEQQTRETAAETWKGEANTALDALEGAQNPSTLIWKQVRAEMHETWIPADIRDEVVKGVYYPVKDADGKPVGDTIKDTEFMQRTKAPKFKEIRPAPGTPSPGYVWEPVGTPDATTGTTPTVQRQVTGPTGNPRGDYFTLLNTVGYPAQLAADVAKNFKNDPAGDGTEKEPSVLTMYALFTANRSGVSVEIQAFDLSTDPDTKEEYATPDLIAKPIEAGDSKLMMYHIQDPAGKNIFKIEFRAAGKGVGHPPQVKAGEHKLEPSLSSNMKVEQIASASGAADVVEEPEGKEKADERHGRRGTLMQENIVSRQNKKLIRSFVRDALLTEAFSKTDKKEIEKIARKQSDAAIKDALGDSFFGTKGKINKFVIDSINKEVGRILKDKATKQEIADVCKTVMVKLYRELAITYRPIIDRIKV